MVNKPKFGRFYLLPKIHKRLHNVPGRPVISNSGYYTENISAFLEHHLKPISQKLKSYIQGTNGFLRKLDALPSLTEDIILSMYNRCCGSISQYPSWRWVDSNAESIKWTRGQDGFDKLSYWFSGMHFEK